MNKREWKAALDALKQDSISPERLQTLLKKAFLPPKTIGDVDTKDQYIEKFVDQAAKKLGLPPSKNVEDFKKTNQETLQSKELFYPEEEYAHTYTPPTANLPIYKLEELSSEEKKIMPPKCYKNIMRGTVGGYRKKSLTR